MVNEAFSSSRRVSPTNEQMVIFLSSINTDDMDSVKENIQDVIQKNPKEKDTLKILILATNKITGTADSWQ